MKNRIDNRRGGFTLIETLVASTCAVIALGGMLMTFVAISRLYYQGSSQMRIQAESRYGIERMAAHISAAELIVPPTPTPPDSQWSANSIELTAPLTNLSSDITSSQTSIPVDWTGPLPSSGVIYIDDEAISYGAKTISSLTSCSRGALGTNAASHDDDSIVYLKLLYYLSGTIIYLNTDGTPSTASDERVVPHVEKAAGAPIFQHYPPTGSYKTDRLLLSFICFHDKDSDHIRDVDEPGFTLGMEIFPRNR